MTKEEAIKSFEIENGTMKHIASLNKNHPSYKDYLEIIERNEMATSALSEELSEDGTLTVHVSDGSKVTRVFVMGDNIFGGLYYPDSAKTDTAKPEEGAELIDRRQIKWYGCDHEGHIKGINCDTADCSKCFFATVEHDEVMSLPVYRIPDSAEDKGDLISRQAVERLVWKYLRSGTDENIAFYEHFLDLPSADVRENIHGHWIKDEALSVTIDMYRCSSCSSMAGALFYNFCPKCGAIMDGEPIGEKGTI